MSRGGCVSASPRAHKRHSRICTCKDPSRLHIQRPFASNPVFALVNENLRFVRKLTRISDIPHMC
jgi:hypothetical protein